MRAGAYTRKSWEMSAVRNTDLFVLLFSLDIKFVNTFQKKNTEDYNTHYKICPYLSMIYNWSQQRYLKRERVKSDMSSTSIVGSLQSIVPDAQLFLQPIMKTRHSERS